jgi:rare lipoprotein A
MHALTAAHPALAFGTRVTVINLANDKSVVVTINDRGPYAKGRIIDLSRAAAARLDILSSGTARVCIKVLSD